MKVDFDELYRSHYRRVFGLCLRLLGQRAQAEDAAQEVFVRAYRARGSYDPGQPFSSWVLAIASNHCIDLIRRRSRTPRLFDDPDTEIAELESAEPAAAEVLADAEREADVRQAIETLPDNYRVPIVLAYYHECSYDEIAERLGITRNHVGVLLLRGRRALRRALTESDEE